MVSILSILLIGLAHEYHVSITEMKWNEDSSAWEITIHTFIEDLEYVISHATATNYKYSKENPKPLEDYVRAHFQLDNRVNAHYDIIGMEDDGHDLYVHIEYKISSSPDNIVIKNTLLTSYFDDQQNAHHITFKDIKQSAYLNADKTSTKINFNE